MAKDKTTVRFWLRTDRTNKDGTAPIHLIYQIQGSRKYYSIPGIKLLPVNWDIENQEAVYLDKKGLKKSLESTLKLIEKHSDSTGPEITRLQQKQKDIDFALSHINALLTAAECDEINFKLSKVKSDIAAIEKRLEMDGKEITTSSVIEKYADQQSQNPRVKRVEPSENVAAFIEKYIAETTSLKKGTLKEYKSLSNHIQRFEQQCKQPFAFEKIDVAAMKSFHGFLLEQYEVTTKGGKKKSVQINNITAAKLLSTLKTVLRRAESEYDIIVNQRYKRFTNPHPRRDSDLEVIALTEDELTAIYQYDFSENKRLDQARDIFCFSCVTGLRYSDLRQLKREHIKRDNFIRMASSEKNGKKIEVPLTPISYAIIQKYEGRHMPLPTTANGSILSCQKLNQYLKEVATLAGLDTQIEVAREYGTEKRVEYFPKAELVSIHVGRKTFTSLSLEKGIPLQDVMALTTHTSFKAVKRYINVTKEQKKAIVAKAWGEVKEVNKLKSA